MNQYSIKEFREDIELCKSQLAELGYKEVYVNNYELRFNSRLVKTLGRCIKTNQKNNFRIELSSKFVINSKRESIRNTIIHELIHSLPNSFNHQSQWKLVANKVNHGYGYNVQRLAVDENYNKLLKEQGKYLITCNGCKTQFWRLKRSNFVKSVALKSQKYKCSCGSKDFTLEIF